MVLGEVVVARTRYATPMCAPTATGLFRCLRQSALLCGTLFIASFIFAQQFQFGLENPPRSELLPPRVNTVSGPTAARLEQAKALAGEQSWDEAISVYRELIADDSENVVLLDDSRFVNLRTYCHMQLAQFPLEAIAVYRRQVDPLAEQLYRDGLTSRDERQLQRVVDEFFCSSWGDDALLAAGEISLERGDYAAARRAWQQISPQLRSPDGLTAWIALQNIGLDARWPEVERQWSERPRPPDWLAYPDSQIELAGVRARLVLVSIRAGQLERAAFELDLFRRLHPTAIGRLGGQVGPLAAALERLLTSAGDLPPQNNGANWPTFAGSPTRSAAAPALGPVLRPTWSAPVSVVPPRIAGKDRQALFGGRLGGESMEAARQVPVRESARRLSSFPVVEGGIVLFQDSAGIHAVDLATGEPAISTNEMLHRDDWPDTEKLNYHAGVGIAHGVPRYTLTVIDGVIYARIGSPATSQLEADEAPENRLIGLDLSRDGLMAFRARPDGDGWSFDGTPVGDGRRLYVAMRRSDVAAYAYVVCFDVSTGAQVWQTQIGLADTPAAGRGEEITHNLLTLVEGRLYFNTNLGLIAALDADHGRIEWLFRYERTSSESSAPNLPGPPHFDRNPSPCLYHDGLVIVAPSDTPTIIALDADTGKRVWATDKLPDVLHLLSVVRQNLIVSGNRLAALDVRTGHIRFIWPQSEHAGLRGMGRGVVAGQEIFWPTRSEIYVFDALTGERTRSPISFTTISENGANLVAAHGRLIIAGYEKLIALGPNGPVESTGDEAESVAASLHR
jgi:outer membrane protein assembly factor BamB/tetratricopeptide (TPR) repeat protein